MPWCCPSIPTWKNISFHPAPRHPECILVEMIESLSGAEFKKQLRAGQPKMGIFVNSASPTIAEQLAHSGYDWLLVDTQHGPMGFTELSGMLAGVSNGGAKSMVRVAGYHD